MAGVEGFQPTTLAWIRAAYRGFRSYLDAAGNERKFLAGDLEVQGRVLDEWVAAGRSRGLSRVTLNNNWRALRILFSRIAAVSRMINPLAYFSAPRFTRALPRVLPRPAAERVLAAVRNHPWRDGFERSRQVLTIGLMLLAGLRRGEVLRLRYGDVDSDARTIRIVRGKGRDGGKDRTAYMTPQLAAMVRAYDSARRDRGYSHPVLLLSADADQPISVGTIRSLFRIVSRAVGSTVTPHALRHSYATLLRQAGVPDRVAMELLGHTSLQMLQRYSHVFDGEERDAAARLVLSEDGESTQPDQAT